MESIPFRRGGCPSCVVVGHAGRQIVIANIAGHFSDSGPLSQSHWSLGTNPSTSCHATTLSVEESWDHQTINNVVISCLPIHEAHSSKPALCSELNSKNTARKGELIAATLQFYHSCPHVPVLLELLQNLVAADITTHLLTN